MLSDTDPKMAAMQREIFRRMTKEQRAQMAIEMSESMRNVALDGIRLRQRDLTAEEQKRELLRVMYGFTP
jgi:hypothetical protein